MRGTLASCQPSLKRRAAAHGFTLLELLVVLAVVALLTGVVAPAVIRGIAHAKERSVAVDVQTLLEGLPVVAFGLGRTVTLDSATLNARVADTLPQTWRLRVEPPLQYGPSGVASGGHVQLLVSGLLARAWRIEPISGKVVALPATGPPT